MPAARFNLEESRLIAAEYAAGESAKSLGRKYRADKDAIHTAVRRGGGALRSRTEAYSLQRLEVRAGQRFGRLIVDKWMPAGSVKDFGCWKCDCDCGGVAYSSGHALHHKARSCGGCGYQQQVVIARNFKHGHARRGAKTKLHHAWENIKDRCHNPNTPAYRSYGAKGIRVCARWRESFVNFAADVGSPPTDRHSIDRIDNSRGYSCGRCEECAAHGWPANVRWATSKEQSANRSVTIRLTHGGRALTLHEWEAEKGIPYRTLYSRLQAGWPDDKIITTPHRKTSGTLSASNLLAGIRRRCLCPTNASYPNYGGRGITVCARWRVAGRWANNAGAKFAADVGPRPSPQHTVERIDNEKGYWCGKRECPECGPLQREPNCRWATRKEQAANRRPRRKESNRRGRAA